MNPRARKALTGMAAGNSKPVVVAAFVGNTLVAITKFIAAGWTGSSAMLSEAIHSLVDTSNQVLLLYGLKRAERPPDVRRPLGYGREVYFWSFIVALLMFTIGAGVTLYEGILHIRDPREIVDAHISYIVLACAAVFEGVSWFIALREFSKSKGDQGYYQAMRQSKDPPTFIVLFEDSAALIGLLIAFLGTLASDQLGVPVLDGVASIGISVLLAGTALVLARESMGLLIGEPANRQTRDAILAIAQKLNGIERAQILLTVHLAPDQVVVALRLEFRDDLTAPAIEKITAKLERRIHDAHPDVIAIFVKPQPVGQQSTPYGREPASSFKRLNAVQLG
ncbi:MAG TPA: cation diffusion facilitator family transporter [Pseudolabrys sp.]